MSLLLRVETPFAVVEIRGERQPRAVLLNKPAWPIPEVGVDAPGIDTMVTKSFPLFFEEEEYEFLAQSKVSATEIVVSHRDERTLERLRTVPGAEPSTVVGTLRFRQKVGLTTFGIAVGAHSFDLTLEVFPSKLDYLDDYFAMVSDVRDLDRALPLRFFDETYRRAALAKAEVGSSLEWLAILRSELMDLQRALRYANAHPLVSLEQHEVATAAHRIKRGTEQVRRAISRGEGRGAWVETPFGVPVREQLQATTSRDSLDCLEHRWLRTKLEGISNLLESYSRKFREEDGNRRLRYQRERSDKQKARSSLAQQADEVESLISLVASLRGLPIIAEASREPIPASFSSLRLLRTPGYSEAYRLLTALQLGLANYDGEIEISVMQLGALYEAWCFVEVIRQIEDLTGAAVLGGLDGFLTDAPLGTRLIQGRNAEVTFDLFEERRLTVRYNREYFGLTGSQRPDIELEFVQADRQNLTVLLDAKYRLDTSREQISFYGIPGPPPEAIGALHRYRDAIVMRRAADQLYRPVVRGAALFPLSRSESGGFSESKLAEALELYGIGAVPLLPGNTSYFAEWLGGLLSLSHEELAWNGPPGPLRGESTEKV